MDKTKEIKRLQIEKTKLEKQIDVLEQEIEVSLYDEYQKYIGKCFKYPNSDGESDFFTYFQVHEIKDIRVYGGGKTVSVDVSGIKFDEVYKNTFCEGITYQHFSSLHVWEGYPIGLKEFKREYEKVLALLKVLES